MATMHDEILVKAVEEAKSYKQEVGHKRIWKEHFESAGVMKEVTFRKYLDKPETILRSGPEMKDAFLLFYRFRQSSSDPYFALYKAIHRVIGENEARASGNLTQYYGTYTCYRMDLTKNEIRTGTITIQSHQVLGYDHFVHTYERNCDDHPVKFVHTGPVYLVSHRLYLVGIGYGDPGVYVRPMIIHTVDNPLREMLVGMLMTETWNNNVPISAKTVLVSAEAEAHFYNNVFKGKRDEYENFIVKQLKNEAKENSEYVLYGWGRSEDRQP